jgi:hypothetical protein
MSSNLSDKLLREKLASINPEFDPTAWDKMEALLDKKKKRRGFIWWWTGGIAAGILVAGLAVFSIQEKTNENGIRNTNTTISIHQTLPTQLSTSANNTSEKLPRTSISTQETATKFSSTVNKNKNRKTAFLNTPLDVAKQQKGTGNTYVRKKNTNTTHPIVEDENLTFKTSITADSLSPKAFERAAILNLENLDGYTLAFDDAKIQDSSSTTKTKAINKKAFNYSLGVTALVSASSSASKEFYNRPSYMVGITHDFLFVNRFAISNSVMFSKTSFQYNHPVVTNFSRPPFSYTSSITEVAIPIGIKVYPVSTPELKIYISTGVINHIKIRETFEYVTQPDTPLNIATPPTSSITYPEITDFNGYQPNVFDPTGNVVSNNSTADFSINKAKRYYASFYVGIGVEYILKERVLFFAEPTFYLSLQKIGVQEKRKYNVGALGGIRYKF